MFETLGLSQYLTPAQGALLLGLALGLGFGALGLVTGFCLRRALAGPAAERPAALAVWLLALAAAVVGVQGAVGAGWIDFVGHRFTTATLPLGALVVGGGLFGIGMVLTRGCGARLTVLAGTGNLRALVVVGVIAVAAMATLRGVGAPLRGWLGAMDLTLPQGSLPGPAVIWAGLVVATALAAAWRARLAPGLAAGAVALGLLVPAGWVGTGLVLQDDFDPIPFESLSFVGPLADALFWTVAASAIGPGFGVGLVGGTLAGSLGAALATRRLAWTGFDGPAQMRRYLAGGVMMGTGGALAGGCTVGAGLAGVPSLGIAALVVLVSIAVALVATDRLLRTVPSAGGGPASTPAGPRAG